MTFPSRAPGRFVLAALALLAPLATLTLAGCSGSSNNTSTPAPKAPAVPAITGISPTNGPAGTLVTIDGTGFNGVSAVLFGTVNAASYTVVSPTEITAVVPAQAPIARTPAVTAKATGSVATAHVPPALSVTVVTSAGTSAATPVAQFSYVAPPPPAVSAVSPTTGPTTGGTSVTITGSGFLPGSTVSFGGTAATAVTFVDSMHLSATSPAGSAGTVDVTVTDTNGTSAIGNADQFTYVTTLAITGVNPSSGPTAGGTSVTIAGIGFTGATAVDFGNTPATSFTVVSATQITATSPAGSGGTVDVTVTTPSGTSATSSADQFTYALAPTITIFSPTSGPDGTVVTIIGSHFTGATQVYIGTTASFTVVSDTQITATVPHLDGAGAGRGIVVITPSGSCNAGMAFYDTTP